MLSWIDLIGYIILFLFAALCLWRMSKWYTCDDMKCFFVTTNTDNSRSTNYNYANLLREKSVLVFWESSFLMAFLASLLISIIIWGTLPGIVIFGIILLIIFMFICFKNTLVLNISNYPLNKEVIDYMKSLPSY